MENSAGTFLKEYTIKNFDKLPIEDIMIIREVALYVCASKTIKLKDVQEATKQAEQLFTGTISIKNNIDIQDIFLNLINDPEYKKQLLLVRNALTLDQPIEDDGK